jgi:hypothetical protein
MKEIKMTIKMIKEKLFYLVAIGASIFFLFFFIGSVWIGYDAKSMCLNARRQYKTTDCVEALIAQLDDEHQSFRSRNNAIWGLGAMGDRRALPVLQKYYTGNIPDREPLDDMISQYELKKSIDLANGGLNITAWVWRWGTK